MLLMFSLGLFFAGINYIRGRGLIPKAGHVIASLLWAVVTLCVSTIIGYPGSYAISIGAVTFIGMLIWQIGLWKGWGGWGLYFASWTWVWNPNQAEVPPIDWIGLKLVPFKTMAPHWTNGLRGTICMGLRGLYILPLFYLLQMFTIGVFIGLAQGLVYGSMRWLAPEGKGTEYAEPVYGFLIGMAIAYRLGMGF